MCSVLEKHSVRRTNSLAPSPQIDVLALALLRVLLAHLMLLSIEMLLVGPSAVRENFR